jgi:hypothetical protein
MAINGANVAVCAAAGAIHVEPRHARLNCGADRRRSQCAAARCKRCVPSLDDATRFRERGLPIETDIKVFEDRKRRRRLARRVFR